MLPHIDSRRPPPVQEARIGRLEELREELTKAWLLRAVERASLEEIERMPTDRIARELPLLITGIVRAIGDDRADSALRPGGELHRLAAGLATLRRSEALDAGQLLRDIAGLQSVLVSALREELGADRPGLLVAALERLTAVFGDVQASALEELLNDRSRRLEWLANTDPLTGLYNVRFLRQHLDYLLDLQKRYGHPFAILLLDVNGLKRVNDSYGHAAGDRMLLGVAAAIREVVRAVDTPVRSGGDEFCILCPHQDMGSATTLADRVSQAVEGGWSPDPTPVSVSIGVVTCPWHGTGAEGLMADADEAMYRAKAAGQRVAVAVRREPAPHSDDGY